MSVFKTTFSRALRVIPSDNCNVPSPHLLIESKNTNYDIGNPNILTDNNIKFSASAASESDASQGNEQYLVGVGDVVYCYASGKAATILEVIDSHNLLLNEDLFGGSTDVEYKIYQEGPTTGLGNQGAYLYLAGDQNVGQLSVITIGGDYMLIPGITKPFFPIQVKQVLKKDISDLGEFDIYAVW